ncbi:MAG: hypothetical protein U0800_15580 [Isosphaeraceae bacterium]
MNLEELLGTIRDLYIERYQEALDERRGDPDTTVYLEPILLDDEGEPVREGKLGLPLRGDLFVADGGEMQGYAVDSTSMMDFDPFSFELEEGGGTTFYIEPFVWDCLEVTFGGLDPDETDQRPSPPGSSPGSTRRTWGRPRRRQGGRSVRLRAGRPLPHRPRGDPRRGLRLHRPGHGPGRGHRGPVRRHPDARPGDLPPGQLERRPLRRRRGHQRGRGRRLRPCASPWSPADIRPPSAAPRRCSATWRPRWPSRVMKSP